MRIDRSEAIAMIESQLFVKEYERAYCVVDIPLKDLRKKKKDVNDIIRNEENEWINKQKTKEVFKFLEAQLDEDNHIRVKYSTLIAKEVEVILDRYSCTVRGSLFNEIYWYPEKAKNLIQALSYLNVIVLKDLKEELMEDTLNFEKYNDFWDFQDDFKDELPDEISWEDTTNLNLYPEYNYND